MTKEQSNELFEALDVAGTGQLGMNEFLTGLLPKVPDAESVNTL